MQMNHLGAMLSRPHSIAGFAIITMIGPRKHATRHVYYFSDELWPPVSDGRLHEGAHGFSNNLSSTLSANLTSRISLSRYGLPSCVMRCLIGTMIPATSL